MVKGLMIEKRQIFSVANMKVVRLEIDMSKRDVRQVDDEEIFRR